MSFTPEGAKGAGVGSASAPEGLAAVTPDQTSTQLDRWIERRDAAAKEVVEAARALRSAWWSSNDMDERERMDAALLAYDIMYDCRGCVSVEEHQRYHLPLRERELKRILREAKRRSAKVLR